MSTPDPSTSGDSERFDALAAAAEVSELDVLPSLIIDEEADAEPEPDLLTAQDLAHLTGDGRPSVNGWESPAPPTVAPAETNDGIDAPVSKALVFPLVAVALAAVAFVAYSILSTPPPERPDAVALIDRPTTTTTIATTTTAPPADQPGVIGLDLAEQAEWLCAGDQFSIARAEAPSLATYNDLLTVTKDGPGDWFASPDVETLRGSVPSLIGCLTTADGGEIDRCPSDGTVISRRSVMWTYRVLQSIDGATLGSAEGTAVELLPCETLLVEAAGEDLASWSPLPRQELDEVAAAHTEAPHPQVACPSSTNDERVSADSRLFEQAAPAHATIDGITDVDVTLPAGWQATADRPVEVVMCLEYVEGSVAAGADSPTVPGSDVPTIAEACDGTVRVHAMHRDGQMITSWDYVSTACPSIGEPLTPPDSWWLATVGPTLGYETEPSETEGS